MTGYSRKLKFVLVILCLAFFSHSWSEVLDDSLSPQQQYRLRLQWLSESNELSDQQTLSTADLNQMIGLIDDVDVRLNTNDFVGSRARIYLRLPRITVGAPGDSDLRLAWTTEGIFNGGEVSAGTRSLLFEGTIEQGVLREVFDFKIYFRAMVMHSALRIEPIYEIEVF